MMKNFRKLLKLICFTAIISTVACKEKQSIEITADHFHDSVDKVVDAMVHDIFSPPVASRVFAYPNIAAYEIMAQKEEYYRSLSSQLNGLTKIPEPNAPEKINYELAALIAHLDLNRKLVFTEEIITSYRDSLYTLWEKQNAKEFEHSKAFALQVSNHIEAWMGEDNYKQTRTMSKYSVNSEDLSKWQPTPPAYMDGIEPHWDKIRPFVLNAASQFKPVPPPAFSMEENSEFYKELKEVYDISNEVTEKGDDSEEIQIAQFWDCNPYVSITRGHLMFAAKKITPGAHWIGIAKIASRKSNFDFTQSVYAHTKTSITIFDAFISCWDEKYRSNLVRPETLINMYFNDNWKPILQTPPFPEYTSGHSVVSNAAAECLTAIFGEDFAYDDDTEIKYGLPVRSYTSFKEAAAEATISRLYGGIHYRSAIEVGKTQGENVGKFVIENLGMIHE